MTDKKLHVYADPEMPGNAWKTTLPDGSFMYFDSKEKAQKFAAMYTESVKNPPKSARFLPSSLKHFTR